MNATEDHPDPLLALHQGRIRQLSAQHGALHPRVFGSRAKGSPTTNSDLDLLVEMAADRDLLDLIALKQDLEDLLGCAVDVVTERSLSPYLRDQVVGDARPL